MKPEDRRRRRRRRNSKPEPEPEPEQAPGIIQLKAGGAIAASDRRIKALVFGPTGVGKTYALSASNRVAYLTLERQGFDTIEHSNPEALILLGDPLGEGEIPHIRTLGEFAKVLDHIEASGLPDGYDTVVVDGFTELQEMMMDHLARARGRETAKKRGGEASASDEQLSKQDWGVLGRKGRAVLRRLRDLPYHLVVTARSDWSESEDGEMRVYPLIKGSTKKDVGGYLNCVLYMYSKQETPDPDVVVDDGVRRYWLAGGDEKYNAKGYRDIQGVMEADIEDLLAVVTGDMDAADVILPNAPLPEDSTRRAKTDAVVGRRRRFGATPKNTDRNSEEEE